MRIEPTKINPLFDILCILPVESKPLLINDLARLDLALKAGGVHCETNEELIAALGILDDLGLLKLTKNKNSFTIKGLI